MAILGERHKVPKILNYPPGEGLNPGGVSMQAQMETAMKTGAQALATQQAQAAQAAKAATKKEDNKTS
jgi:hypothetical protein